ncbi:F-box protein [Ananas comosus]|uniref:F-box protein n=1 Tax=Ananas comosus TaxID=4615 RepID=A0A199VH70_ANACO|nr:F-box protein [Ananas comosus]
MLTNGTHAWWRFGQRHMLPSPLDDEKLPVGTGSNPTIDVQVFVDMNGNNMVFLVSNYVIKIYVEGGLESTIHGFDTELEDAEEDQ